MNKKLSNLRYYTDPVLRFPTIPKISIQPDGFMINETKVTLENILSVFYRNTYSPSNTVLPFVGSSYYCIKTTQGRLFFYGEHEELAQLFDEQLEKETHLENVIFGLVTRWKKAGEPYQQTSFEDAFSKTITEKFFFRDVDPRLIWVVIGIALFFLSIGIGTFIYFFATL